MPRILGIDPGSTITGYAVIEGDASLSARVIDCIRLPRTDFPTRLGLIFSGLSDVIAAHQPDEMAIEDVFVSRNAASALKLGQARGAAICAAASARRQAFRLGGAVFRCCKEEGEQPIYQHRLARR